MTLLDLYVKCRNLDHRCGFIIHDDEETKNFVNWEEVPWGLVIKPIVFFEVHNCALVEVWF